MSTVKQCVCPCVSVCVRVCQCVCVPVYLSVWWSHLPTSSVSNHDKLQLPVVTFLLRVRHDAGTVSPAAPVTRRGETTEPVPGRWIWVSGRITDGLNERWVGKQTPFWLHRHRQRRSAWSTLSLSLSLAATDAAHRLSNGYRRGLGVYGEASRGSRLVVPVRDVVITAARPFAGSRGERAEPEAAARVRVVVCVCDALQLPW